MAGSRAYLGVVCGHVVCGQVDKEAVDYNNLVVGG